MSAHTYRITLEYAGGKAEGNGAPRPLRFTAADHDNLFDIVARVRGSGLFGEDEAAALALGMKLFSGVMLEHRDDPLFQPMAAAYRDFIVQFKDRMKAANASSGD